MKIMYEHVNKRNGKWSPLLSDDVYEIIKEVSADLPADRECRARRPSADHPRLDDRNLRTEWREHRLTLPPTATRIRPSERRPLRRRDRVRSRL